MSKLFGDYIRTKREALRKGSPEYSIRKVAKRIGIHHSYLSKVERGEPATLSEKRIISLAQELGDDPELLMAMNGKVTDSVRRAIFESPELFSRLVREIKGTVKFGSRQAGAELAALRSLRDMSIMQLDTDMRVVWAKPVSHGPSEVVGRKCHEVLFGKKRPCESCPTTQAMASGKYHANEVKDPQGKTWLIGSTPITKKGEITGFLLVAVDISHGKEMERFRAEAERLMFHDIKTPLSGIISMARSLHDDGNLSKEQVASLVILTKSGEQLMRQVCSSMDIHSIESGKGKYVPEKVDVADIVRNLGQTIPSDGRFSGISMQLSLDGQPLSDDDQVWAIADKSMTGRVLSNLMINAFEASKVGDVVGVDLSAAKSAAISVHNSRCVSEDVKGRFFEKYATSGKDGGLGLGTYGAKLMVELMGGTISFESDKINGTTVTVILPS